MIYEPLSIENLSLLDSQPDRHWIRPSLPALRTMKTIVEFALLAALLSPFVNAQASEEQWYVYIGASPAISYQFTCRNVAFFPFAPLISLSVQTHCEGGALIHDIDSAAQICCKNGNQDLSASCWSQCSSYQQQLAEIGCHILPPTPTSSSAPQVAPTLTTSWGPGQTANLIGRLILILPLLT